jgi:hypothetical protein
MLIAELPLPMRHVLGCVKGCPRLKVWSRQLDSRAGTMLFEKPRGGFTSVMSLARGADTAACSTSAAVTVAAATVAAAPTDGKLLTQLVLLPFLILRLMLGLLLLLALLLQTSVRVLDLLGGRQTGVLVQPGRLLRLNRILPALILLVLKPPSIF